MTAFIFAAGIGSRLRPLTDSMPKALVPLAGKPLFDHVADTLKHQGADRFVVNVHHFADMLREHIASRKDSSLFHISDETDTLRDTGGAVLHAATLLGNDDFLIHNVDIISNFNLQRMMQHLHADALATLLVSNRPSSRYLLFNDYMQLVGWTNVSTGEIKSPYKNLDVGKCRRLAFAGIHYLSHNVIELMSAYPERFSIIDFYLQHAGKYRIYGYEQPDLQLMDVGKPESLLKAENTIIRCNHIQMTKQ